MPALVAYRCGSSSSHWLAECRDCRVVFRQRGTAWEARADALAHNDLVHPAPPRRRFGWLRSLFVIPRSIDRRRP